MSADLPLVARIGEATTEFAIKRPFSYLKRKYGYVKDMSKNYHKLMEEYRRLCAQEQDVEMKLKRYVTEIEETNECKLWREEVKKIKLDVEKLKTNYRQASRRFYGFCPSSDLIRLGRRIVKQTDALVSLTVGKQKYHRLTNKKVPDPDIRKYTNKISEFPYLDENLKKLLEYLKNDNTKIVAIWGPIGVGKSTLMECLHLEMEKAKEFEIVFWIPVGRRDEEYIQEELLMRLQIKPEKFSGEERTSKIHEQLKNKSYLLILDEVFSKLDFKKIGINAEHKGKVVFASRYFNVCAWTDEQIEVKRLSDEDSQNMFWEKVGVHLKDNPDVKREAEWIIKFCSGIPYLIKLIGNHLVTKARVLEINRTDPALWRNTLHELRSPTGELKQDLEEVYKSLKLEMEELSEDEKHCFQYLANFPAGYELDADYIIECWRA